MGTPANFSSSGIACGTISLTSTAVPITSSISSTNLEFTFDNFNFTGCKMIRICGASGNSAGSTIKFGGKNTQNGEITETDLVGFMIPVSRPDYLWVKGASGQTLNVQIFL